MHESNVRAMALETAHVGTSSRLRVWLTRSARVFLGAIFLVSGTVKALDAASYLKLIPFFGLPDALYPVAFLLPSVEVALGVALLLGLAPGRSAWCAAGLLVLLSAVVVHGVLRGTVESCGCFGQLVDLGPQATLIKNGALLLLAAAVWYGYREQKPVGRRWPVWVMVAILPLVGTATGLSARAPLIDQSLGRPGAPFPSAGFVEGEPLLEGRHFVFVFHPWCGHCWNSVANVKALASYEGVEMLAVTFGKAEDNAEFVRAFETDFPIYRYAPATFVRAFRIWPALYYVEDGRIVGKVEGEVPAPLTVERLHMPRWTGGS